MTTQHTYYDYGTRDSNGVERYDVLLGYGDISTPEARRNYQEQHTLTRQLQLLPDERLTFLKRKRVVVLSEAEIIDDSDYDFTPAVPYYLEGYEPNAS